MISFKTNIFGGGGGGGDFFRENSLHAGNPDFACFFVVCRFKKNLTGMSSECQTNWIQTRVEISLNLHPNSLQRFSTDVVDKMSHSTKSSTERIQKNHLNETILWITHNTSFCWEIRISAILGANKSQYIMSSKKQIQAFR